MQMKSKDFMREVKTKLPNCNLKEKASWMPLKCRIMNFDVIMNVLLTSINVSEIVFLIFVFHNVPLGFFTNSFLVSSFDINLFCALRMAMDKQFTMVYEKLLF